MAVQGGRRLCSHLPHVHGQPGEDLAGRKAGGPGAGGGGQGAPGEVHCAHEEENGDRETPGGEDWACVDILGHTVPYGDGAMWA